MIVKLEYVWLDGYEPEPNLRSKVKTLKLESELIHIDGIPNWNFDGSSTKQADGENSDCILKPVQIYLSTKPSQYPTVYVFCEVMNSDGSPHESNRRALLGDEDSDIWFGFEQEYFIKSSSSRKVLGLNEFSEPQGKYYCGIGHNVKGRDLVDEHYDMCLDLGINITGINAEVAIGQWEFQVFGQGKKRACDDLWMSRYILNKLSEKFDYEIEYHPKPLVFGDWNGSGLHTNFSNGKMRDEGGEKYFQTIFKAFESRHNTHIEVYGSDNHMRLTGKYETQSINKFSWGISDRGASIRVPQSTAKEWKGYLEDRRPAANLGLTLNNMYSNVGYKQIDELAKNYKAVVTSDLLNEYKED